ncbi:MAG: glutathione S-transferase family protein [Francisellaceae bacterium]
MYTLYSLAGSCSTGITILLEKLNVPYQVVQRGSVENYKELVPTGQVPALKDGELLITEGAAIALYLLEKHDEGFQALSLEDKAQFYRALMFNYATLHPAYSKVIGVTRMLERDPEHLAQRFADKISELWHILDQRLAGSRYVFGNSPTIVDYLLFIYSAWAGRFFPELTIKMGKNVQRLVHEVAKLPEVIAAFEKEDIILPMASSVED